MNIDPPPSYESVTENQQSFKLIFVLNYNIKIEPPQINEDVLTKLHKVNPKLVLLLFKYIDPPCYYEKEL